MDSKEILNKLAEFKKALPINKLDLDGECSRQAPLYTEVGTFVMEIRKQARDAKGHMEFIFSKLKHDIRESPGMFGVSKITGDSVIEAATIHKDYQEAFKEHSTAQYIADCAIIVKEAAEQRKSLIRDAVSLFTHEYYMGSKDMGASKAVGAVSEDQILDHRRRMAAQRVEDIKEEQKHD